MDTDWERAQGKGTDYQYRTAHSLTLALHHFAKTPKWWNLVNRPTQDWIKIFNFLKFWIFTNLQIAAQQHILPEHKLPGIKPTSWAILPTTLTIKPNSPFLVENPKSLIILFQYTNVYLCAQLGDLNWTIETKQYTLIWTCFWTRHRNNIPQGTAISFNHMCIVEQATTTKK